MDIFGNNNHLRDAVNFFVYDTIKIFILLIVIIFIVSIIRSFLPPEKIRKILSRKDRYAGHILAALLGIVTPFCTCSAIPLFLGFIEAGVPLGVTFTFLVASPMINEVALIMLFGMFGWKVATLYIASGMLIAVVSGLVIGALKPERLLEAIEPKRSGSPLTENVEFKWGDRIKYAKTYVIFIIKKVWLFILIGVGAGAFIHGYVPMDFLAKYAGGDKWYAVPLAALIGIPLYSNAAGIIPLVSALTEKGVAMGTTLAFMMAVTGLSLPEFLILRKVMKARLILAFAGIVGLGIILTGYLFNIILR
ncbi:MAG: permease [Candidatus Omnitrophica bacterium]|nr:permease [Candidatus Omnitrophota bacterium]